MGFLCGVDGISMGFLCGFCGISVIFLWGFFGGSMLFLLDFYDISMGFPLGSWVISMGFPWAAFGISLGFQRDVYRISIGFQSDFHGISMVFLCFFLWDFSGVSVWFPWNFYRISMLLLLDFYGGPMAFLWNFHDVSIIFLWDYYVISEEVLWEFNGLLMGFPLDSYRIYSMVCLWCFYGISLGFLWGSYGIPLGDPWCFYNISKGMLWKFYGILMGFPLDSYRSSMVFLWCFYWIPVGLYTMWLLWHSYGGSMMCLWYFHGITMGFPVEFYGILTRFLCGSYAISVLSLWSFYGISAGFLCDIAMIFLESWGLWACAFLDIARWWVSSSKCQLTHASKPKPAYWRDVHQMYDENIILKMVEDKTKLCSSSHAQATQYIIGDITPQIKPLSSEIAEIDLPFSRVFLQGQDPNNIWSIPWKVAPCPLKERSVHFQMFNPPFKGAAPLLEKSIFLQNICNIIDIEHPCQKRSMLETVSTNKECSFASYQSYHWTTEYCPVWQKIFLWRSSILGKLDYSCLTCVLFPLVRSAQPSFRQLSIKEMFSITIQQ